MIVGVIGGPGCDTVCILHLLKVKKNYDANCVKHDSPPKMPF